MSTPSDAENESADESSRSALNQIIDRFEQAPAAR
jgi:hypothetical protein